MAKPGPDEYSAAAEMLRRAGSVAVLSHLRPDGDAVCALLGLALQLERMGKTAVPVLADGLPARYRFLPGAARVTSRLPAPAGLTVAVDCSSAERLGFPLADLPGGVGLNIDHHATNTSFASLNLVDRAAASTTEVLYNLSIREGLPLDPEVATNFLAGLVTDTIGFRTSNVTPEVLRTAAELMERGAPLTEVYDLGLNRKSIPAARYWGCGLASLQIEDGVAWASLTAEDRRRTAYPGLDDADLVNLMGTLDGVEVALVFVEQPAGRVKVSWRSRSALDVSRLALRFGGGGHEPAAGATIEGDLETVKAEVLAATRSFLHSTPENAG